MTTKNNWANRTKEALTEINDADLKPVGNGSLEPISKYYNFNPPKEGSTAEQLLPNTTIYGTYEGSFTSKNFGSVTHKVRTEDGLLVGVPGSGQLNKLLDKVAKDSRVKITYRGKEKIASGAFAGKQAHSFIVAASAFKE